MRFPLIPLALSTALMALPLSPAALFGEGPCPPAAQEDGLTWHDIASLGVEGRGFSDTKEFYDRLPARAEGKVRKPVWDLSRDSAGLCVRFSSNAPSIHARWVLRSKNLAMPHMPATGVSGLDLYVRSGNGRWRWLATGKPVQYPENSARLAADIPEGTREYLLYLPLYNGVTSVEIGVPEGAKIANAPPRPEGRKPLVFYGTSITQGGCASRPGMVHTAILGRWLNHPVINLGFSGNGRMEPEMAELLAELDPALYVLDCLPNMDGKMVAERVGPFVHALRKAHPETPILLVEDRTYSNAFLNPGREQRNRENRAALRKVYEDLQETGIKNVHYLRGDLLLDNEADNEATVDGSHPTDLGFMRQAKAFLQAIEPILSKR